MITALILIAFAVNGLLVNPVYLNLLQRLKINMKPFNCALCFGFWLGLLYIGYLTLVSPFNPLWILFPFAASFLATAVSSWFNNQPVTIK